MKKYIVGFDAGGTYIKAGLYDTDGVRVEESFIKYPVDSSGRLCDIEAAYRAMLSDLKGFADARSWVIEGAAVDIPGPFDYEGGISRMTHKYRSIFNIPLRPWFEDILGKCRLFFVHDSAAFLSGCLAELSVKNASAVMIGTGFGFALAQEGRVITKADGTPYVSLYGAPYRGGIAEDIISARGIVSEYARLSGTEWMSAKDIGVLAERGDPIAIAVYENLGGAIAEIISEVLSKYKIEVLFMGGQISKSLSIFRGRLECGLSTVSCLKKVCVPENIDTVHTDGAVRLYLEKMRSYG